MQNSSYDLSLHKLLQNGGTPPPPAPDKWVRPSEWPDISGDVGPDNKIVGLIELPDDVTNYDSVTISLDMNGSLGTYSVDWGDGIINSNISNGPITHTFDKTSVNLTTTSYGYKIAKVIITADGGSFINVNFLNTPWLEIDLSIPNAAIIGNKLYNNPTLIHAVLRKIKTTTTLGQLFQDCNSLECFEALNDCLNYDFAPYTMFGGCSKLYDITLGNTGAINGCDAMFLNCISLKKAPMLNLSNVTSTLQMFSGCVNLQSVPLYDLSSVTDSTSMFSGCYELKNVPLFDLSSLTTGTSMFSDCRSLETLSLFDLSSLIVGTNMFYNCSSLTDIPLFNLSNMTTATNMFNGCSALKEIPLFVLSSLIQAQNMFYNCVSLKVVPTLDLSSCSQVSGMFSGCVSIEYLPLMSMPLASSVSGFINNCKSLKIIEDFSPASVHAQGLWQNCVNVYRIKCKKFGTTQMNPLNLSSYLNLGKDALEEIFTNLPVASRTINITNTRGASDPTLNRTIATSKGWTVVG